MWQLVDISTLLMQIKLRKIQLLIGLQMVW